MHQRGRTGKCACFSRSPVCARLQIMIDFRKDVSERFIRYTRFDTMSDPSLAGSRRPTTPGQVVMQKALVAELEELGLEVTYGEEHVVHAILRANAQGIAPVAFMAHVDTADDVMGNGVKARVHDYEGGDIVLDGTVIRACDNPDLARCAGGRVITSDGTTLLGGDDKAGVAEIMEAVSYLVGHPEVVHGDVEVFFTPDEETGAGMDMFPYHEMISKVCYTLDGGPEGEIETECFNAATVDIAIHGVSTHLGSARGRLVNALKVASMIADTLPHSESPEATDGRYGYYHVGAIEGTNVEARMEIFIRDFDSGSFDERIRALEALARAVADIYHASIDIDVHVSYRNMASANARHPEALEAVMEAGRRLGLDLHQELIRGGTDGARMAERAGVPCPNLFTGGHNFHSLEEWVSVDVMSESVNMVLAIIDYQVAAAKA